MMRWFLLALTELIPKLLGFLLSRNGAIFSAGVAIHGGANFLVNIELGKEVVIYDTYTAILILFIASTTKTILLVKMYDYFKKDIFGIEMAKNNGAESKVVQRIRKIVHMFEKQGKFITQLALILADNFFGVVYTRSGHDQYNGIPKNIWLPFLVAMFLVSVGINIGWEGLNRVWDVISFIYGMYIRNY